MSDSTSSSAAHAESDAHHASICKAASCGSGCGPDCQCGTRLQKLEKTTKRMLFCLWVALFVALMILAFAVGRKVQARRTMAPRNMMGQFDQRTQQFRDNNRGPDSDKPMRQPRKRDGASNPPPPPANAN